MEEVCVETRHILIPESTLRKNTIIHTIQNNDKSHVQKPPSPLDEREGGIIFTTSAIEYCRV